MFITIAAAKRTKTYCEASVPKAAMTKPARQLEKNKPSVPIVRINPESEPPISGLRETAQAINVGNIGARKNPDDAQTIILKFNGNGREAKVIQIKAKLEAAIRGFP